jgi:two-component system LytT family response regulator
VRVQHTLQGGGTMARAKAAVRRPSAMWEHTPAPQRTLWKEPLFYDIDAAHLSRALARARNWKRARRTAADDRVVALLEQLANERTFLERLPVRSDGRLVVVDLGDVDWRSAADNYVTLHTKRRQLLVRDTMAWVERELDPARFVRVHRGTIVNVERIAELIPESHGVLSARLRDGTALSVSRRNRDW